MRASFSLGSIAGVRIEVHYTWFVIFFLLSSSLFALFNYSHPEWEMTASFLTALATTLLFFASIVLHELGHSLVAIARGIRVRAITLFIFGGVAQTEKDAESARTELWIAIAGPAVSFVLAGLFYVLKLWLAPFSDTAAESFGWLATINLLVAVFNLVPGFPLDGGRVFRALVWHFTGDAGRGMRWAVLGGKVVAYGLMVYGLLTVLLAGLIINGLWLLGIGWFLFNAAEASGRSFVTERLLANVSIGDIMQADLPGVETDVKILDWVDQYVLHTGQRAFKVTKDAQVIGLITMSDIRKIPRRQWPSTPVGEVMTALPQLHTVGPDKPVNEAFRDMNQEGINQLPVVRNGQIIGWVERQQLLKIISLHSETGR